MKVKGVNKGERQQLWKKGDCPKPKKQDEIDTTEIRPIKNEHLVKD